jgi:protein-tyrosine phosphatase
VDDGATSFEESVAMLRLADASGTRRLVATPHLFRPPFLSHGVTQLRSAFDAWRRRLARAAGEASADETSADETSDGGEGEGDDRGDGAVVEPRLTELCVELSAEHHLSPELFEALASGSVLPLGTGRRLLVELPLYMPPEAAEAGLERVFEAGFQPLLAHVERYGLLLRRRRHLRRLLDMGCLLQLNAEAVVGPATERRSVCDQLLQRGWIHAIASDGHHVDRRPPSLGAAAEQLVQRFGAERARRWLAEGPAAILDGAEIPPPGRGLWDWWESLRG